MVRYDGHGLPPTWVQKEKFMHKLIWVIALMVLIPCLASAQSRNDSTFQGYVFAAPGVITGGGTTAQLHFGGGLDAQFYKGLGIGAEVGYAGRARAMRTGFGIFSVNGSYHFSTGSRSGKFDPFVTGGYSLFFRSGTLNALNFGVGTNYWLGEKAGLRLEFRDHAPFSGAPNVVDFRIGLTFR
jgi:hypothetical protein